MCNEVALYWIRAENFTIVGINLSFLNHKIFQSYSYIKESI